MQRPVGDGARRTQAAQLCHRAELDRLGAWLPSRVAGRREGRELFFTQLSRVTVSDRISLDFVLKLLGPLRK
jgi:hypothetical protein